MESTEQSQTESPFLSREAEETLQSLSSRPLEPSGPSSTLQDPPLDFSTLVANYPHKVLHILEQEALIKLGDFSAKDHELAPAFGDRMMVTRGRDERRNVNFERFWKDELSKSMKKRKKLQLGWSKDVHLSAYVLNINNATASGNSGLLHKVLLNLKAGFCDIKMFELPAVRAIVDYKWRSWIGNLLYMEIVLYICWMGTYWIFLIAFLSTDEKRMHRMNGDWTSSCATISITLAFCLMWPFIIIEFYTIMAYKYQWFSVWNMIDLGSYGLQMLVFIVYIANLDAIMDRDWFSVCLAIESVLLFFRLQYYARAFGSIDVSFVDTLQVVLKEVKWFFLFIFLAVVSFSLAFGALFRGIEHEDSNRTGDFSVVWKSMISTFGFMMGGFDVDYFFDAGDTPAIVGSLLFVVYQTLINITLLNLLVAIIIESYTKIKSKEDLTIDHNRAEVIDEMEMTLPPWLQQKQKQFIHILVIKNSRGNFFPESISLPQALYQQESVTSTTPPEKVTNVRRPSLNEAEHTILLQAQLDDNQ